jgi:two-component system C4-dicarboxylate transport sensor histidine kinase DctB
VDGNLSDKIFEPFFSTKTNGTNVGLGLAMCRDTLRKMGGDIRLLPSEKGARFEICAPVGDRQENIWVNRQEYSS